jgi:hypothetical protein
LPDSSGNSRRGLAAKLWSFTSKGPGFPIGESAVISLCSVAQVSVWLSSRGARELFDGFSSKVTHLGAVIKYPRLKGVHRRTRASQVLTVTRERSLPKGGSGRISPSVD